jgi:anti-anti-sigma factor
MEVTRYSFGGIPLLSLAGDFDHASAPYFTEVAEKALGGDGSRLLLQLTDCPYLDSGGMSCLLSFLRRVRHSGWLGVIAPTPNVLRLLQIVGLTIDPSFRVFSRLDDVQTYLQEPVAI